jgi:2-polyprenyl-3-methyl-5-hydroxy-6-metoxy-1,4-benzoquinol methylase
MNIPWRQDARDYLTEVDLNRFNSSKLAGNNFGRALVLVNFGIFIEQYFLKGMRLDVAVVGGSIDEPELMLLAGLGYEVSVEIFGIDEGDTWLDLNESYDNGVSYLREFDLVLCSQVLEHVWNHSEAIKTLSNLLKPEGFLWLACPASNKSHASPHYYSAGFSPEYLESQVVSSSLNCVSKGQIGTARLYKATHLLPTWLSVNEHVSPFLFAFSSQPVIKQLFFRIRYLFTSLSLLFSSGKVTTSGRWATESWIVASRAK